MPALCEEFRSPEAIGQPLLVALVTAISAAVLEAGTSLAWNTSLQDGKGSGARVWEDSAVTCSAVGG